MHDDNELLSIHLYDILIDNKKRILAMTVTHSYSTANSALSWKYRDIINSFVEKGHYYSLRT